MCFINIDYHFCISTFFTCYCTATATASTSALYLYGFCSSRNIIILDRIIT